MKNNIILKITTDHIKTLWNAIYTSLVGTMGILISGLIWNKTGNQKLSITLFLIGNLWLVIVILREWGSPFTSGGKDDT